MGERTTGTTTADHLQLLCWAEQFGDARTWAIEDCRHLSRRLERDLLGAGERIVRVPPKMMAHARDGARTYGKSDPIDALAVARAALREPNLPTASLDGPAREVRLLADHRDDLVAERTRAINRLRWHLHELDPAWAPPARSLWRAKHLKAILQHLTREDGTVARLARGLVERCRLLTAEILELDQELEQLVRAQAPALLEICGCATLSAAKILGETAGVRRFRSRHAYARHNGTAPLPVWSGNNERHRLSRTGNRQINAAIHRIAITQAHYHPDAKTYLERRRAAGDNKAESIRALKRRLSDVVFKALTTDAEANTASTATAA
ncbi:IS110 family transposase [Nocardioides sp. Root140]|uniref:IS110 family transposase n=1 Tax=Nocardioides cremeus TaxID=3058044 RepID=A0ABT8TXP2_9ACTN|nr:MULTISPECIES: IS110 family transposase [Nocardioides]MDO3398129.1 IS110 family transposase [Nocardioides cremeus]